MASGTYTQVTLSNAWELVGQRLYDPDHVRWPTADLTIYIRQAIRTFNAFTKFYKARGEFETISVQTFYPLETYLSEFRSFSYTLQDAVREVSAHLMEPSPVGVVWKGTDQYNTAVLVAAIREARDQFLLATGAVITDTVISANPFPTGGRLLLDENILNVRRATWETSNGFITNLLRDDEWAMTVYDSSWNFTAADGRPTVYSVGSTPPLTLQLARPTSDTGRVNLLTINKGVTPDLLVADQSLGIPDDWGWVVVFGALSQLLRRDGLALDPSRAAYCDARWKQGVELATAGSVVLQAQINDTIRPITSISDADFYSAGWQMVPGIPRRIVTSGQNMVGIWPPPGVKPGGGQWTVTLSVVRNAPIPGGADDYLQLGSEALEGVLAYAQHLASFKEGPGQLEASLGLLEQFYAFCGIEVPVLTASSPNRRALMEQTTQDERVVAYTAEGG